MTNGGGGAALALFSRYWSFARAIAFCVSDGTGNSDPNCRAFAQRQREVETGSLLFDCCRSIAVVQT